MQADHRGELERRQWRLDEAAASFEEALEGLRHDPGSEPGTASLYERYRILDDLAEVELLRGRSANALAVHQETLDLARENQDPQREMEALSQQARLYAHQGRFQEADRALDEALLVHSHNEAFRAALWLQQAGLALATGDYEEAENRLWSAAYGYREAARRGEEMGVHLLLTEVSRITWDYGGEKRASEKALALAATEDPVVAKNLAEALAVWNRFRLGAGPPPELRQRFEAVLDSLLLDHSAADKAELQNVVFHLAARDGAAPGVLEKHADRFLALARELQSPWDEAKARAALGATRLLHGRHDQALPELEEALRMARQLDAPELEGMAFCALAELHWKDGRHRLGAETLAQGMRRFAIVLDSGLVDDMAKICGGGDRQHLYRRLVGMLMATGQEREAFRSSEEARAWALFDLLGPQMLNADADDEPLAAAEALRLRILEWERRLVFTPGFKTDELREDLRQARRRYRDLLERLSPSQPSYAALAGATPVSLEELRATLDPTTTLVDYFVTSEKVVAWVIDRERFEGIETDMTAFELGAYKVPTLVANLAVGGVDSSGRFYRQIFAPLRPAIRHRKVIIVPHDDLHLLPIVALRDPASGRYLVEDYILTQAPSASALRFLRAKASPFAGRSLILGDPKIKSWVAHPLTGSAGEAEAVAEILAGHALLGPEATESRVHDSQGRLDVLHLEAHGLLRPENPRLSHVALAADDRHDGNLTLSEVLRLDLSGVDVVTLAAGRTEQGELTGGDAAVSLVPAFLHAGSAAVLVRLGTFGGTTSIELLEHFYRRLRAGSAPAAALRQAQLRLLKREGRQAPAEWAAWTLTGAPDDDADGDADEETPVTEGAHPAETALDTPPPRPPQPVTAAADLARAFALASASEAQKRQPQLALLLAVEGLRQAGEDMALAPGAQRALRSALATMSGSGLSGHRGKIGAVAISADGRWLATGDWAGVVQLWDLSARDPAAEPTASFQLATKVDDFGLSNGEGLVSALGLSGDGRWLAVGCHDGSLYLRDFTAAGAAPALILQGRSAIEKLLFSADGSRLIAVSNELVEWRLEPRILRTETLPYALIDAEGQPRVRISRGRLWLLDGGVSPGGEPGREVELRETWQPAELLDLSPDGRWLFLGGKERTLWDLQAAGKPEPVILEDVGGPLPPALIDPQWLEMDSDQPTAARFDLSSRWLAVGSSDGGVRLWSLEPPVDPRPVFLKGGSGVVMALAFSPDGRWLAIGSLDGSVRLWDLRPEQQTTRGRILRSAGLGVFALEFTPDSRWLVSGSMHGTTPRLWDLDGLRRQAEPQVLENAARISAVSFTPDGRWLATGAADGEVRLWDLKAGTASPGSTLTTGLPGQKVLSLSVSADSRWLAATSADSKTSVWRLGSDGKTELEGVFANSLTWPAFDPKRRWLALGGPLGRIELHDLRAEDLANSRLLATRDERVSLVFFSPDGRFLLAGDRIWRLESEGFEEVSPEPAVPPALGLSPDGRWLATQCEGESLCLYRFDEAPRLRDPIRLRGLSVPLMPVFSGDSRWIATAGETPSTLRLWSLGDGTSSYTLRGHQGQVLKLTASPDGWWLASAALDATPYLWDLRASDPAAAGVALPGSRLAPVLSPEGLSGFYDFAFSPDGRRLATVGVDGTLRLWELDLEKLMERGCRTAGRNLSVEEWQRFVGPSVPYTCTCPALPPGDGGPEVCKPRPGVTRPD